MTQKPTDQMLESLSAMVDGEASELELRRILNSLDDDGDTLSQWHRYHLVGAAMRKEAHIDCSVNLLEGISAEINGEIRPKSTRQHSHSAVAPSANLNQTKWKLFAGQSVIAASVAAAFIFSFHFLGSTNDIDSVSPELVNSSSLGDQLPIAVNRVPIGFDLPLPEARVVSGGDSAQLQAKSMQQTVRSSVQPSSALRYSDDLSDMATQQLLDELLIEHAGRASVNGSLGIMPFARVSKMGAGK